MGRKHSGEKEKLFVTSYFSFTHSVFKRLQLQTHKNMRSFGKGSKAFVNENSNVADMMISVFKRVENIVGKAENTGYHHFLLFPQCFKWLLTQAY